MSTKAIRMVLGEMKKTHDWLMIDEAFQELEAIERAAKVIGAWVGVARTANPTAEESAEAHALMVAIAKDAP